VDATDMVRRWRRTLKEQLLGNLHGHQINALSACSCAMAIGGHCHSGRMAAHMVGPAKLASHRRRIERLIANDALDVPSLMQRLAGGIFNAWQGGGRRSIVLILDETTRAVPPRKGIDPPQGNSLCCMKLSVGYRKRALPLGFECYRTREPHQGPRSLPRRVIALLKRVAAIVPPDCEITLLADRGLCWPVLVDFCKRHGWHYVLRLQGQTALRYVDPASGQTRMTYVNQLLQRKGQSWFGNDVEVFKTAGWRTANVIAVWEARSREPWLLVSDLPASYARCRGYAKRCWCEQMHRDEKSSGFQWRSSHVNDPQHAARLLLLMALAMLLAISTGSQLIKAGLRDHLEPRLRRQLSVFQLGLRWLRHCLHHPSNRSDCRLHLYPS